MSDQRDSTRLIAADRLSDQDAARRALLQNRPHSADALHGGGGGGTSGGMTDDWKASVERQLSQLHDDFRRVVGWIITGIAIPMVAIFGLYVYTGNKIDGVTDRLNKLEVNQQRLSDKIDLLLERTAPAKKAS